ncbi:MAG: amino acid transporter [Bacteroidetes bacterium GWE2_41_25]|nr:MAG: amino acid transporter [Bacteroidetes bacterium GWA2_40_15]OFX93943.1 MAG: amino acid transporter [Bacteroidetes bacterium GWE2_41_25]OFY00878.1 MAG: amino acid transporter [Bacteroidetes bacterium GWC2_40_22]OFY60019.1 MAG: amino acid transporter [Bacteroidetes bacterium GWF2_41_9]HAM09731.1 amino acid transporter [Bacteroidales bacterium]
MSNENHLLQKRVTLFDGVSIVAGAMIGSGIFIVSADIARNVGSPGWLMMVWIISGVITIIGALSYGELAAMMPSVGGQYVYLRESYHPLIGFLFGWTTFLVIQCGSIAAVAVGFAKFSGVIFPWISDANVLFSVASLNITTTQIVAIGLIVFLTWLNTRGIVTGKTVQNIFTSTKVIALLGFIIVGLLFTNGINNLAASREVFWQAGRIGDGGAIIPIAGFTLVAAVGTALVGSLFASDAWYNITYISGEVINPKRTVPLSLLFGTLLVSGLYLLTNFVYIRILPMHGSPDGVDAIAKGIQFATDDRVATSAMSVIIGDYAAIVMAIFIMISTFGCNQIMILAGPRVYYAMAVDGLFFKKVGSLNRRGVPAFALILQGVWSVLLCLSGTYGNLLDYVIFAVLLFFALTILAIFILRAKRPDIPRPYKAFGYPYIPALYILTTVIIMVILLIYKPDYTFPGLGIVLLGIPVFYLWKRFNGNLRSEQTNEEQSN